MTSVIRNTKWVKQVRSRLQLLVKIITMQNNEFK